eukprot:359715-Chlamydomonas_euryale.AAC.2
MCGDEVATASSPPHAVCEMCFVGRQSAVRRAARCRSPAPQLLGCPRRAAVLCGAALVPFSQAVVLGDDAGRQAPCCP